MAGKYECEWGDGGVILDELSSIRGQVDNLKKLYDNLSEIGIEFFLLNKKIIKYLTMPELFNSKEKDEMLAKALKMDWSMEQFLHGDYKKEEE